MDKSCLRIYLGRSEGNLMVWERKKVASNGSDKGNSGANCQVGSNSLGFLCQRLSLWVRHLISTKPPIVPTSHLPSFWINWIIWSFAASRWSRDTQSKPNIFISILDRSCRQLTTILRVVNMVVIANILVSVTQKKKFAWIKKTRC